MSKCQTQINLGHLKKKLLLAGRPLSTTDQTGECARLALGFHGDSGDQCREEGTMHDSQKGSMLASSNSS